MRDPLDRFVQFVTTHNLVVVLVMLVLTAGMVVGMAQLDTDNQADETEMFPSTDASVAGDYIEEQYGQENNQLSTAVVYVRDEDGNVLSRDALIEALRYQQAVRGNESVADSLAETHSVANLVGTALATTDQYGSYGASLESRTDHEFGDNVTLAEQRDALEAASDEEVAAAVETLLASGNGALGLLPESYEAGAPHAESHRMLFQFDSENGVPSDTQHALFEEAGDRPAYFTLGEHATDQAGSQMIDNTMGLVVPLALALVLGVLAVTYRDPVDILVGLAGVVVSVLWMFGILGWLGVSAGMTMVVGPVLVAGLSIDFSFHVFNRYREQRGALRAPDGRTESEANREQREARSASDGRTESEPSRQRTDGDGIRPPMARGLRSVAVALGLVTVTAGIGFLSNVVNPVGVIRDLGIGITLGVVSAFVVFMTLVPALKVSIDGALERFGVDRRRAPLGHGSYLRPALGSAVVLAKRAAPVVIVVALVVGTMGGVAWTTLDEESFQQQTDEASEWKQQLPGPLAWETPEFNHNQQYVQSEYLAVADSEDERFQLLIEGSVTDDGTLQAVHEATDGPVFQTEQPSMELQSPVTVIQSVAAENESFAATVDAADTTGDGIPDTDLETVYDHLYAVAPDRAAQVVERTDGEYRSLRVVGPAESAGFEDDRTDEIEAAAAAIEDDTGLTATAVSQAIILDDGLAEVTSGILHVLIVALTAVSFALVVIFRRVHGSGTVGAVTALPILLVAGLVVGGMALLDVPLTMLTALLMSLVIGLGIDYNIHLGDRFVQELERGQSGFDALETAVTGTGGALLGSALTSSAAFLALTVHPHPQFESFGLLVVLALFAAFLVSVLVLPSLLAVWWRYRGHRAYQVAPEPEPTTADD